MKTTFKRVLTLALAVLLAVSALSLTSCKEDGPVKIGVPDDATNLARAIKLLESQGFIEVDPAAGYSPELKDITKYIYNIEIVPTTANTLTSTLQDYTASTINGTYATSAGLVPSKDGIVTENQGTDGDNPYVNIIVARTAEKDKAEFKAIVEAFQTAYVGEYMIEKYNECYFPCFDYEKPSKTAAEIVAEIDAYESTKEGKTVIKVGVCGSSNDHWKAVQKILDDQNAGIYIQLVEFDAYNLPNQALNEGYIDLNSFQHKAYLNKEIDANGYALSVVGDTLIATLTLYSNKVDSIQALKDLAGLVEQE